VRPKDDTEPGRALFHALQGAIEDASVEHGGKGPDHIQRQNLHGTLLRTNSANQIHHRPEIVPA
jgi:hypothetical protein